MTIFFSPSASLLMAAFNESNFCSSLPKTIIIIIKNCFKHQKTLCLTPSRNHFWRCYAHGDFGTVKRRGILEHCNRAIHFFHCYFRTPLMAAMHEDDSPELKEVGRILRDILEVYEPFIFFNSSLIRQLND